jgi:hypothetical protein
VEGRVLHHRQDHQTAPCVSPAESHRTTAGAGLAKLHRTG